MPPQQRPLIRVGNRMVPGPPVVNANLRSLLDPNADITIAPETFQANVSALQPAVAQEPVPLPKILDLVSQLFAVEQTPEPAPISNVNLSGLGQITPPADPSRIDVAALQAANAKRDPLVLQTSTSDRPMSSDDLVKTWINTGPLGIVRGMRQIGEADLARSRGETDANAYYRGGTEMLRGAGVSALALMGPAMGAASMTGVGAARLGAALVASPFIAEGASRATEALGGSKDAQDFAREFGYFADPTHMGAAVKAGVLGAAVMGGIRKNVGGLGAKVAAAANAKLAEGRVANPLKAYHGSPHDFEQFSMDKIGTGEGAQAYGHGLYFADSPAVAKSYQESLSQGDALTVRLPGVPKPLQNADIDDVGLEAIKYLESGAKDAGQFKHNTAYYALKRAESQPEAVKARIKEWADAKIGYEPIKGRMYEVDLHTDLDALLDWDGPIPAGLQKQLGVRGTVKNGKELYAALHNKAVHASGAQRGYKQPGLSDPDGLGELADRVGVDITPHQPGSYAESDFRRIRSEFESRRKEFTKTEWTKIQAMLDDDADATASALLREAGVPGLKYFDANSRPMLRPHGVELVDDDGRVVNTFQFSSKSEAEKAIPDLEKQNTKLGYPSRGKYVDSSGPRGEGTRNYVIWETKVIDLLRKYGILPPVAAAVAHESIRGGKKKDQ